MGGVIDDIAGIFGGGKTVRGQQAATEDANANRASMERMWERQFGPVSDSLRDTMMKVLEPSWLDKFKGTMRSEIESGIRPSEEAARSSLQEKVRSSPKGMSASAYTKGLKDIVTEGAKARGNAFRSGMTTAELTPLNLALSFMGRTPFAPNVNTNYPPDYKVDTAGLKMLGGGLADMFSAGKSGYDYLFGPRDSSSGFESFMGDEGGNMGMGDLSSLEEGEVF